MNIIDKLAFLDIKDRRVLVTLSKGKDVWYIPGGKREEGESDHEALIREVKEELTIELIPSKIKYYATFEAQAHGKEAGVIVRMTCYMGEYDGQVAPSMEIAETKYVSYDFIDNTAPVDHLIFDDLKQKGLID